MSIINVVTISDIKFKEIYHAIDQLLEGRCKLIEFDNLNPHIIVKYLHSKKIDIDITQLIKNGWSYNYLIHFDYNNETFKITGSGFYGNTEVTFVAKETDQC